LTVVTTMFATALEHVRGGKAVPMAVGEPGALTALPDIPGVAETVPGFEVAWVAIFVQARTPKDLVRAPEQGSEALLRDPEW